MRLLFVGAVFVLETLISGTVMGAAEGLEVRDAAEQVRQAEIAFAKAMAERDLAVFEQFVADDAIFFTSAEPLRGKPAVLAAWRRYFQGPVAPFSWAPDRVEVLASGMLALSTGPVRNPGGKIIARFNSVWRSESPGVWRVVFDKGSPPDATDTP